MTLSEAESKYIDPNISQKQRREIKEHVNEMQSIYNFIEKTGMHKPFMDDCERFMGFTFLYSKQLVKHSIALENLTKWLIGLTICLVLLTAANIYVIIR